MDFEKLLAVLQALGDQSVEYVLVGAIGLTVHGIVRATQDVDLFVRPEKDNVARLRAALRSVFPEDAAIEDISASDLAGEYPAIRYSSMDGSLVIDLLARLGDAFSYEDIRFEEKVYEGTSVRVATPEMLYAMKKNTMRLQDHADAELLKEQFDLGKLTLPIRKFHSLDEAHRAQRIVPGTAEHSRALRSVFWMAARFAPDRMPPPGVHKYRSVEEAQAQRKLWGKV